MCIRSNESLSSYNVAGNLIVLVAIGQVLLATLISISHLNLTSSYSIRSDAADSQPIPSSSWFIYRPPIFLPDILHISSHTVPFSAKADQTPGIYTGNPTTYKRPSWTRIRFRCGFRWAGVICTDFWYHSHGEWERYVIYIWKSRLPSNG